VSIIGSFSKLPDFSVTKRQVAAIRSALGFAAEVVDAYPEQTYRPPAGVGFREQLHGARDDVRGIMARWRAMAAGHRREIGVASLDRPRTRQPVFPDEPRSGTGRHLTDFSTDGLEVDQIRRIRVLAPGRFDFPVWHDRPIVHTIGQLPEPL